MKKQTQALRKKWILTRFRKMTNEIQLLEAYVMTYPDRFDIEKKKERLNLLIKKRAQFEKLYFKDPNEVKVLKKDEKGEPDAVV